MIGNEGPDQNPGQKGRQANEEQPEMVHGKHACRLDFAERFDNLRQHGAWQGHRDC